MHYFAKKIYYEKVVASYNRLLSFKFSRARMARSHRLSCISTDLDVKPALTIASLHVCLPLKTLFVCFVIDFQTNLDLTTEREISAVEIILQNDHAI